MNDSYYNISDPKSLYIYIYPSLYNRLECMAMSFDVLVLT